MKEIINICLIGFLLISSKALSGQYLLEKLGDQINTEYDEISPIVMEDGKTLFFTRLGSPDFQKTLFQNDEDLSTSLSRKEYARLLKDVYSEIANKKINKPIDSKFNQDVWIAVSERGDFDKILHPGFPINNALPNSICAYSFKDYALMVINQFGKDGSLYHGFSKTRQLSVDQFAFPEPIYIHDFYSQKSEVSATISYDADVIILSLDRPDSHGGLDLYASFKVKENLWSAPKNLGPDINTDQREITPFLSRDKRRLFFASNRKGSNGGMDIFVSRRLDIHWKKWTKPRKLMPPINSVSDDTQPFYDEFNDYFYFTSKRDGSSDIFRVNLNPEIAKVRPVTIVGTVKNKKNNQLIPAEITYKSSGPMGKSSYYRTNDGRFEVQVDFSYPISFHPQKNGFKSKVYELDPENIVIGEDQRVELKIEMDPLSTIPAPAEIVAQTPPKAVKIESEEPTKKEQIPIKPPEKFTPEKQTIKLGKIMFVQSKPQILASSFPQLNKLVKILKENKSMEILVEGHTDNIGDPTDLITLSEQRAKGIKEYLVYKGIAENRVHVRGHGASIPLNDNASENKRKANRRVEIKIIKE